MTPAPGSVLTYGLAALVAGPFLLLPGLGIAWGLGRRAGWCLARVVAAAFAFGLLVVGVIALAAHYAGLSLTFTLIASALVFLALTVAGILLGRGGQRLDTGWQGLALAGIAATAAVWQKPWFAQTADTFYHLAAIRSLLVTGRPMVTDPFYGSGVNVLDPTSGVWHTALAAISRVTGLDPMWVWPGATAVGAAMTVLCLWVLAKRVSGSAWAAVVATLGFVAFPLSLDMRWMAYPNRMSLAVVFLALAAIADLIDEPRFADAALLLAAGFAAISLHMASAAIVVIAAVFLGVLLVVDVVVERARSGAWEWRPLAIYVGAGAVLAVLSAAVILPKAGVVTSSWIVSYQADSLATEVEALRGGWLIARPELFREDGLLLAFATLIGLAAAVPAFVRGDRRALAVAGICLLPAALLFDPPLSTWLLNRSFYLTSRVALLLRFPLYVGMAWGLAAVSGPRRGELLRWGSSVLAVAALAAATYIGWEPMKGIVSAESSNKYAFVNSRKSDIRAMWGPDVVARAASVLGTGYPMIAGDFETTYYLSGLMPVRVVAAPPKHAPFQIEVRDGEQRRKDVETLLDLHTPKIIRREILERRGVDYLAVSPSTPALMRAVQALRAEPDTFEPVLETHPLVIFRVAR